MFQKNLLVLVGLSFLLGACTSISSLQTAKTTPKGKFSHTFGLGSINAKVTTNGVTGVKGDTGSSVSLPMIEYMIRYGATEDIDVGFKTSGFSHGVDGKWRFYQDGPLHLAVGGGLSLLSTEVTTGSQKTKYTLTDFILPFYASYTFSKTVTGYVVPKYINRSVSGNGTSGSGSFTGASVGAQWGEKKGFLFELTFLSGEGESITQYNLGFYF